MSGQNSVLIVGAGPVGLTLAAFLSKQGVHCHLVDKKNAATQTSNAVAIHARTLELMQQIELSESLINAGKKVRYSEVGANKKRLARWDLNHIDSDFPFALCVPQSQTEQILIDHLETEGQQVAWQHELIHLSQSEQGVRATFQTPSGEQTLEADWLVACDGYHSKVRESVGINYPGHDLKQQFIMIDAPVQEPNIDEIVIYTTGDLSFMLFPMKESVRMVAEVSHHPTYAQSNEINTELFQKIAKVCLPYELEIGQALWQSKFWIHERLADRFRQQRVFLAGDSAHAHSPAGGQGMNTGMQDAINLAWKLSMVINGQASECLLDSYEAERRPVAKAVIESADRLTHLATTQNACLTWLRDKIVPVLAQLNLAQDHMANHLGETAIRYKNSPIIREHRYAGFSNGQLCPLRAYRANPTHVLLYLDDLPTLPQHMSIQAQALNSDQAKQLGMSTAGYCLVRPDGYIGYIGDDIMAISRYWDQITGVDPISIAINE